MGGRQNRSGLQVAVPEWAKEDAPGATVPGTPP